MLNPLKVLGVTPLIKWLKAAKVTKKKLKIKVQFLIYKTKPKSKASRNLSLWNTIVKSLYSLIRK